MKKHAIIPIFIPHLGCRHDCIFCNQKAITAKQNPLTLNDMRNTIDTWLTTLSKVPTVEVAFYGGSFTAIPIEMQNEYLRVALHYKKLGKIDKIHLSTRPDAINEEILDNLKYYGVDTIELGVQSFDEKVLRLSKRGHNADAVYESASMIKAYDFELGIQLMIGLPGDSPEACLFSARETVKVAPRIARLYPTIVIENTELYDKCLDGSYSPLTEEEAIFRTKEMYKIIDSAGIKIIRVGLKSSDLIAPEALIGGGSFHPAFRQLVEGQIAKEIIEEQLPSVRNHTPEPIKINVYSNAHSFSDMIGNSSCNKKYFLEKYPHLDLSYRLSDSLKDGEFLVKIKEQSHLPLTDTSIQSAGGYFY